MVVGLYLEFSKHLAENWRRPSPRLSFELLLEGGYVGPSAGRLGGELCQSVGGKHQERSNAAFMINKLGGLTPVSSLSG